MASALWASVPLCGKGRPQAASTGLDSAFQFTLEWCLGWWEFPGASGSRRGWQVVDGTMEPAGPHRQMVRVVPHRASCPAPSPVRSAAQALKEMGLRPGAPGVQSAGPSRRRLWGEAPCLRQPWACAGGTALRLRTHAGQPPSPQRLSSEATGQPRASPPIGLTLPWGGEVSPAGTGPLSRQRADGVQASTAPQPPHHTGEERCVLSSSASLPHPALLQKWPKSQ